MTQPYPKVLIIGQSFNRISGGGITLSNLFKGWPKDCIAVAASIDSSGTVTTDICDNIYSLGENERKTIWPFGYLTRKYPSGRITFHGNECHPKHIVNHKPETNSYRSKLVDIFFDLLHFFGLFHLFHHYRITNEFKQWIDDFNPDIIYTQLASRELIQLIDKVTRLTNKPLAIHIMDDWPTTISKPGLLQKYWDKKIDEEFRKLLDRTDIFLSISEGMSSDYLKRYNKVFIPFHNPVEIDSWLPFSKNDYSIKNNQFNILYSGRIGIGTFESQLKIVAAVESLNNLGYKILYHIQTANPTGDIVEKLRNISCVVINNPVDYNELPKVYAEADLLILPVDFNAYAKIFLKLSMPTKASEFMISGTPILLYCSPELSIYDHAKEHKWAYIVSEGNTSKLAEGILELYNNKLLREQLGNTERAFAINNYNAASIREKFRHILSGYRNN